MKEYCNNWYKENGYVTVAAILAVMWKIWMFYSYMGVSNNFVPVWLITSFLTYLLFASFKNKWIPAAIYLVISAIMFADVLYFSYFNRYLSVNMLGAAKFLGDISASIMAVLKPRFFLLLADCAVVFGALGWKVYGLKKRSKAETETETAAEGAALESGLAAAAAETPTAEGEEVAAITAETADTGTDNPALETTVAAVAEEEPAADIVIAADTEDTPVSDTVTAALTEEPLTAIAGDAVIKAAEAIPASEDETVVAAETIAVAEVEEAAAIEPADAVSEGQLVVLAEVKGDLLAESRSEEIKEFTAADTAGEDEDIDIELDEEELGLSSSM